MANPTSNPTRSESTNSPTLSPSPGPTDSPTQAPTLPACAQLVDMMLVDAEAHEELGPLVRGCAVNLAEIGTNQLSAVLMWNGSPNVKSVAFYLDSATITATENTTPWALLGDNARQNLQYVPWAATIGNHTIVAELFDQKNLNGDRLCAVTYAFTVVDGGLTSAPASTGPNPAPSPGPTIIVSLPTLSPTTTPTVNPAASPTASPTLSPATSPTLRPTASSQSPSPTLLLGFATASPTSLPIPSMSSAPTPLPTSSPSPSPSPAPATSEPTPSPTPSPTPNLTTSPSMLPMQVPTMLPTNPCERVLMVVDAHQNAVDTDVFELGSDGVALTDLSRSAMMSLRLELDESFWGSVEFVIYDPETLASIPNVENSYPYSLRGDDNITGNVDYYGWRAIVGQHTVHIRVFTGKDLSGEELCSHDVTFEVVPCRGATTEATVYPVERSLGGCTASKSHLDGIAECSAAGAFLGLTDESALVNSQNQLRRPYGCTWDEGTVSDGGTGGYLRWNSLGQLNIDDNNRRSICKIVTPACPTTLDPTQLPTPSPPFSATISPPTPSPTLTSTPARISPTPVRTGNHTVCDPDSWDAVKNAEICTNFSACSALIDFKNIVPTNCGEFCASHGLECDDANDEQQNRCQVYGRTSNRYTCDTLIVSSIGWDAICYCSDPPTRSPSPTPMPSLDLDLSELANIVGGRGSAKGSAKGSSTLERESGESVAVTFVVVIAVVSIVGAVTRKVVSDAVTRKVVSDHLESSGADGMIDVVWDDRLNGTDEVAYGAGVFEIGHLSPSPRAGRKVSIEEEVCCRDGSPFSPLRESLAFGMEKTR